MMRNLAILIGTTTVLGLAGCQAETAAKADESISTGAAEDEVAAPVLTEDQANARAFDAAWDAAAPVTASDPRLGDEDDHRWPEPISGRYEFRSGQVVQLSTDLYALISSGHVEGAGRTTSGALAFHYLTRTVDGFRRLDVDPIFIAGGVSGQPPSFAVRRDLTPAPTVVIDTRSEDNDGACVVTQLVELTPSHPVLRATDIPTAYVPTGGSGGWEGALASGRSGRDFEVQYSGASEARATWILTDVGTYRASGQPRLSGC